jgi:hypothetical protein
MSATDKATYDRNVRMVPFDLVKELVLATGGVLVVIVVLAALLSSPDVPATTIANWAAADPVDFVTTATSELAGSSTSADYGPPYNNNEGSVQTLWSLSPQSWAGVHTPVDPPNEFVLQPLQQAAVGNPTLTAALATFQAAGDEQKAAWLDAYSSALAEATVINEQVTVAAGDYGPTPVLMNGLLAIARSGGLDGLLLSNSEFFATDYTGSLLFMGDGGYLSGLAADQKLTGDQWGMMNETGRYPGQAWLWLYTLGYQVHPFDQEHGFLGINSANADLAITLTVGILTLLLVLVPFIPGLRDIPRWIPVHRLIWRNYYREPKDRLPAGDVKEAPDRTQPGTGPTGPITV